MRKSTKNLAIENCAPGGCPQMVAAAAKGRFESSLAKASMNSGAAIFAAGVKARNLLYGRGLLPTRRLQGTTISIGNLSVGGSGKTPFVILLGELLRRRGFRFDVLSRGYGRKRRGVRLVDPSGSPVDYGDEPLLIARHLGVPVVIGEDRYQAGIFAESQFGPQMHLLDDGFQHRVLARDFDIVLVTADDAIDRLLPAGRLREPVDSLCRADAVVLTHGTSPDSFPLQGQLIWQVRRGIVAARMAGRPVAFCGIARPQNFFLQLRMAGIEPAAQAIYRDHHTYTDQDIRELLALKGQSEAEGFVTTEKDAINLGGHSAALRPLTVIKVKMELIEAATALDNMLRIVGERKHFS